MKLSEPNKSSTSQTQIQAKEEPFFNKTSEGGFFGQSKGTHAPFFSRNGVQPKLKIGQSGDKYEVEADTTADRVVNQLKNTTDQSAATKTATKTATNTPAVQTKCDDCGKEEKLQKKEDEITESDKELQTQPIFESNAEDPPLEIQQKSEAATANTSNLESNLNNSKGSGSPLSSGTQSSMGDAMGADFSNVRVHTDSNAVQMNKDLGSQAFTHGNDIYFNEGKYNTNSTAGNHLLAHELTHTVQQGASQPSVQKKETTATDNENTSAPPKPTAALDITHRFDVTDAWSKYFDHLAKKGKRIFEVDVKIGNRYSGKIEVTKKRSSGTGEQAKYELAKGKLSGYLDINGWDFLDPMRQAGVTPILALKPFGDDQKTNGFLSVKMGEKPLLADVQGFIKGLNSKLEQMKFLGIEPINVSALENNFENGRLVFQVSSMTTMVDGFLQAGGGMGIEGDSFTFNLNADVDVKGLAQGKFTIARGEEGKLSGKGEIQSQIGNVQATILAEYIDGAVTIQGTGRIESEKFSGSITLLVTDAARSKQMMNAALGVETMDGEKKKSEKPQKEVAKKPGNQVLAGWGEVEATITPWLQGTAKVGIDHMGHVTIVGEISVPNEVELMEQRGKKVQLFDVEIRGGYGIPLVGQVFLFAGVGMFVNAGFGPLTLKNVGFTGTYSTDPSVLQQFSITGTLGINAFAILGLEAEAGAGVTLLGHDIKAGINVTAAAGLRAYAEATPTFEYKEAKAPEGGKVGESRLKGHFEAAAQLFLQLSGSLFYELDSPWWSPAPDGREDFPLGEVQYPIGDSMGIGADMDWLVGSPEAPELKFSPVEFDPNKFTSDVMADPPPRKMGKSDAKPEGKWTGEPGSDKQKDPKASGNGKGLPDTGKKKEDLKKLPDQQKYMRALDEMSKLEKAKPKPTRSVVEAKAKKVKAKYGLDQIQLRGQGDQVSIYVKHKKENNGKHLLKIPLMSAAEALKLRGAAMEDLRTREKKALGEAGSIEESAANSLITAWHKAHPIVETAKVVDGKTTWDYFIDFGDKSNTEKGKRKKGGSEFDHKKVKDDFKTKSGDEHKIYLRPNGKGGFELIMESTPTLYEQFINKFQIPSGATDEEKQVKKEAIALAKKIGEELDKITKGDKKGLEETKTKDDPSYKEIELDKWVDQLADLTEKLMNISYGAKIPKNETVFGPKFDGAFGSSATVNYLSSKTKGGQSSGINYNKHGVLDLRRIVGGKAPYYLRGHLLNANLHGPDDWKNLTPITYTTNSNHKTRVENELTKHLDRDTGTPLNSNKRVFKYIVIAQYGRGINVSAKQAVDDSSNDYVKNNAVTIKEIIDAEAYVPRHLKIKAIELKPDNSGNWVDDKVLFNDKIENTIEQTPESYQVKGSARDLVTKMKLSEVTKDFLDKWFVSESSDAILDALSINPGESWTYEKLQEKALEEMSKTVRDGRKIRLDKLRKHIEI